MAEGTIILKCSCKHEEQDKMYGPGLRVHNVNTKGEAFCTVCSPSYRRNKTGTNIPANPGMGHGIIPSRGSRNPKKVSL